MSKRNGIVCIILIVAICTACSSTRIPCPVFAVKEKPAKRISSKHIKKYYANRDRFAKIRHQSEALTTLASENQESLLMSSSFEHVPLTLKGLEVNTPTTGFLPDKKHLCVESSSSTVPGLKQSVISGKKDKLKVNSRTEDSRKLSGWALSGFISSIIGIVFWPLAVCGIVFSAIALRKIRKNPELKGKGIAKAGLYIGITVAAIIAIAGIFVLIFLSGFSLG
jgi:hypothetical protein